MKTVIVLADQTSIVASFCGKSLFINQEHILDTDEINIHPIEEIANNIASSLGVDLTIVDISERDIAFVMVAENNKLEELKDLIEGASDSGEEMEFGEWCDGYNNTHVLKVIDAKLG